MAMAIIEVMKDLDIPEQELKFQASPSSGPGGQNVDKVSTRVTLSFDVENTPSLFREQKEKIRRRLSTRVCKEGILRVVSQQYRTQLANRKAAVKRFSEVLGEALQELPQRRRSRPTQTSKNRRLKEKMQRGQLKRLRANPLFREE